MNGNVFNRLVFSALLSCGAFFFSSGVRACPTNIAPTDQLWIATEYDTYNACSDEISIFYCFRYWRADDGLDTVQLWIDSVVLIPGGDSSCIDTLNPANLIYDADSIAYANFTQENSVAAALYCWCLDGCSSTIMEGYLAQCWMQQTSPEDIVRHAKGEEPLSGGYWSRRTYAPCSTDDYCITTCQLCFSEPTTFEPSLPVYSDCNTVSYGTPNCTPLPLPPNVAWIDATCYLVGCIFNAPGSVIEPMGVATPAETDEGLSLNPNPSSGILTVHAAQPGKPISVLDVLGRQVLHGIIGPNGDLILDVSSLSNGTYYISGSHKELKFIKK